MGAQGVFVQIFVFLATAAITVPLARRFGLGSVLGYVLGGILIGPYVLGIVGEEGQDVLHIAEFGVVLMLFLIGLELEPRRLWRMRSSVLGLGGLQVGLTTATLAGVGVAFGVKWQFSLAIGCALALSSTAIVLQSLAEKDMIRSDAGQSAFSVLLFQDIVVIPMLALLPLLATLPTTVELPAGSHGPEGETWMAQLPGWAQTLAVLAAVALVALIGRFLVRPVFRFIARARLREVFVAASLTLVVGIALLMDAVGLSPALGTFLAGVMLATSEYRHAIESDIEPFKGLLLGVFFIAIGASIDFGYIAAHPGLIAGLVAGLLVVKFLILAALGRVFGMRIEQNLRFAIFLSQAGEFGFVLFAFSVGNRILPHDYVDPLIAVVAITMALTPVLMFAGESLVARWVGERPQDLQPADAVEKSNPVVIAGFGDFGNIVGRFLMANGVGTTVFDNDIDRVDLLRNLGLEVYYGDATRLDLLEAAKLDEARLFILAIDDPALSVQTAKAVKAHFPGLTVLARAVGRFHAYELLEAGVDHVYRQTLDTSLAMGEDALRMVGYRGLQASRAARFFRRHDEAHLRELARMRHDHAAYLNRARASIAELERLLQERDAEELSAAGDAAWDPESLRAEFGTRSGE